MKCTIINANMDDSIYISPSNVADDETRHFEPLRQFFAAVARDKLHKPDEVLNAIQKVLGGGLAKFSLNFDDITLSILTVVQKQFFVFSFS